MAERPTLLELSIRTPRAEPFHGGVRALRVPAETGHVGIHPGIEPMVLAVEAGLVVVTTEDQQTLFCASAGGLLTAGRDRCELYTPFAVIGSSDEKMLAELDSMLATPDAELLARRQLSDLEQQILRELHQPNAGVATPERRHG